MEFIKLVVAAILIYRSDSAGGLSANGNMFGNFARWNEPSRDSGSSQDPGPGNPGNPGYPGSGLMSSSQSKKADYKVVNASPDFESSSPQRYPSSLQPPPSMPLVEMLPSGPPMSPSSQPSQPSSQILRQFSQGNKLHIQVYRALMDAVVLDWTISLADKDRMKTCVVTYLAQEAKESTTIDPFMPKTRTFLLENLRPNHSYKFNMSCVDDTGHFLHSDQLEFSTRHLSSLRSTKINENNNNNNRDSSSSSSHQHSGHHSSFISKSDYLTEMNLKLLPAISNSIQQQSSGNTANQLIGSDDPIKVSTSSLSRSYYTKKTSPHAVLGVSCAIFGAILVGITVALALRKYSRYKRSQTRLWELQTVQELERPVMPTFINLPPPYSEQPSPLYNLCASSISSGSNFYEQHMRSIPNPLANQPANSCCHHHHFCESGNNSSHYETLPSFSGSEAGNGYEHISDHKQEVDPLPLDMENTSVQEESESKEIKTNNNNIEKQNEEEDTNTETDTESTSAF